MKIYLLQQINLGNYDEYQAKVIVALNKVCACYLANELTGDEGPIWNDLTKVTCREINLNVAKVILADFNAG